MQEQVTRSQSSINSSFVLRIEDLQRIAETMKGYASHLGCQMQCGKGPLQGSDLEAVKSFPNTPSNPIRMLCIYCDDPNSERSAWVTLLTNGYEEDQTVGLRKPIVVLLDVRGQVAEVNKWTATMQDIFSGMKPWYDPIARVDWIGWLFYLGIFGVGIFILLLSKGLEMPTNYGYAFLLTIFILFVGLVPAYRFRRMLFPMGVFALNKGLERHQVMDSWRWLFIGGVVVAFIINLAAGIIVSRWM